MRLEAHFFPVFFVKMRANEWYWPSDLTSPTPQQRYRLWWLQDSTYGFNDLPEDKTTLASHVYITEWSSRELTDQQLDVVAPGSWVKGSYPGDPGYSHYAWWSSGFPLMNPGNFYYLGGTSMAAPHVTGIVALMLQKNPTMTQGQVELILKTSALPIAPGSMPVFDLSPAQAFYTYNWGANATGADLVQADSTLAITP